MSGDWLKMRSNLPNDPRVVRILSATDADKCPQNLRVVGALHSIWAIFDQHSNDGFLEGYSIEIMDQMIGWPGFSHAMESVGWLKEFDTGLLMPDFERHNGRSAKRRAKEAIRKMSARNADKCTQTKPDKCPQNILTQSGQNADQKRKEKNIKNKQKKSPSLDFSTWPETPPDQIIQDWKTLRTKIKAPVTQTVVNQFGKELQKAVAKGHTVEDCMSLVITQGWRGFKAQWMENQKDHSPINPNPGRYKSQASPFLYGGEE